MMHQQTAVIKEQAEKNSEFLPDYYQYYDILSRHLGCRIEETAFNKKAVYPRQLEIHLGNDSGRPCNLQCKHCQGSELQKEMTDVSEFVIRLIHNLKGKIPFYIFGGLYSEPLKNSNIINIIRSIKKYGSNFGIHTKGTLLWTLHKKKGFIEQLYTLSDCNDYLSVSIDSGFAESFSKTKNASPKLFDNIIKALEIIKGLRKSDSKKKFVLRLTYLLNEHNSDPRELMNIIAIAKQMQVDSLRFSVPYHFFGRTVNDCKIYRDNYETPMYNFVRPVLEPYLTNNMGEKPQFALMSPDHQDIYKLSFSHCFFGYYQITLGVDGYFYRCSSCASPSFSHIRLGKATDSVERFEWVLLMNQRESFNPQKMCFPRHARCNRIATEINSVTEIRKYG
ncbi:radical SAM protein [Desulfococcaceae bacterium HSG8]|nr:radical SAM protein [Desulfococcaceae bacterium HSG8]